MAHASAYILLWKIHQFTKQDREKERQTETDTETEAEGQIEKGRQKTAKNYYSYKIYAHKLLILIG
jgi:hypothetical protein